jgi:hypothetical protein
MAGSTGGGSGRSGPKQGAGGEILFECTRLGDSVRVAAIDPASNTEVVVFGPAAAGEAALRELARRKLRRALQRRPGDAGR